MNNNESTLQVVDKQGNILKEENLVLSPGDKLIVVKTDEEVSTLEERFKIAEGLKKLIEGDFKVCVLPTGWDVKVLKVKNNE